MVYIYFSLYKYSKIFAILQININGPLPAFVFDGYMNIKVLLWMIL